MIAVTGSKGMTGQHIIHLLKSRNIEYREVSREFWDLTQRPSYSMMEQLFGDAEAIFHVGALVPTPNTNKDCYKQFDEAGNLFDANVRSVHTLAQFATARNIPLVFISGATVYKDPHQLNILEDSAKSVCGFGGFYGYTKLLSENLLEHYRAQGLKLITLRPSSIYGSGMDISRLVGKFLHKAQQNELIQITAPVENRVNLVHCADLALAALRAYQCKAWGVYNIAGPKCVTFKEIAEAAVKTAGLGSIEVKQSNTYSPPFIRYDLNYERAQKEFGYRPQLDLRTGLNAMDKKQIIALSSE